MDTVHRAKIFSPYDALRGFDEAISSKRTAYQDRSDVDEECRQELNRRLSILWERTQNGSLIREHPSRITVTYFLLCCDENSEAYGVRGQCCTVSGICQGVDRIGQVLYVDTKAIAFTDLISIESPEGIFSEQLTGEEVNPGYIDE